MQNIDLLVTSLEYIENHIKEDLKTIEIAGQCYCSKSALEKLFRCVNGISVQEYIKRRRMMLAAQVLVSHMDRHILSVALEYGYSSHEAFARAFREVWNCNPSEFRDRSYFELYPRLQKPFQEGDEYIMSRKSVDISKLYDIFCQRKNCWFVCADIQSLIPINEISRKAGDLAILEVMKRMDQSAGEEDMVFRIGGDEFCMLTDNESEEYAKEIEDKLSSMNGLPFEFEGREIPLYVTLTHTRWQGSNMKYNELFQNLHTAIKDSKTSRD